MKFDYHVHTTLSDGILTPDQLIEECRKKGVTDIGITDHYGTSKYSEKFQVMDVARYVEILQELRGRNPDITIHIGLEVDFSTMYGKEISEMNFEEMNRVEYLLFEHVNTQYVEGNKVAGRSMEELIGIRDRLSCPVGLAHNNFQQNFEGNVEPTIKAMKEHEIFLEFCEGEDKGKKAVDGLIFQQMQEIKKNFNSAFEVQELLNKMKANKNNPYVNMKHAIDGKYYFELYDESTWQLIHDYGLTVSCSSDSHKGLELGKSARILPLLKKYDLEKQLIFH